LNYNIKPIKIGKKIIGKNRCYIIAEIGSNFNGNLKTAKLLMKLAKNAGADAAKFQSFKTEKLLSKKGFDKKSAFQSNWKKSVWKVYEDAELPRKWHNELSLYAKKIGIDFFTSPWDFDAVDLLKELKVPAIKVGSGDITYHEILKKIAKLKKPVILGTGASTMQEISDAIKIIKSTGNNKIILLHSITQYPSPIEEANLKALESLKQKFNLHVGYSDHSPGLIIPLASVALGASVIEKHFTIDPKSMGPDHLHSLDPLEFTNMVNGIRTLENSFGNGIKKVEKSEKQTRIIQRRGIWTTKQIQKGEKFSKLNIAALRPVEGLPASEFKKIINKKAKFFFDAYVPIKKSDL
jgi:sialic acid synthase SpsE